MEIKAYFAYKDQVKLYLGDAIEIMKKIPDETIDMIFADPPYNLSNDGFTCHAGKRVSVNKGEWDKSKGIEEDYKFHFNWINECKRILKKTGTLWISGTYHSIYACGYALLSQKWHIINDICWFKPNASPNLSCRMFTASHETLIWAKKDKKAKHTFNYDIVKEGKWDDVLKNPGKQMRSVWAITTPKNFEKRHGKHPTQKPEALLERIILSTSDENDLILDPFCGSATTGVLAIRHRRKFIGIENEKKYLDKIAIPRLKDEIENISSNLLNIKYRVAK
ncbi:MAG: DNA methyltransferase [Spirochaetes bacterium]|nr:DNA methyltransferase [Spirochaetota bacterium]